MKPETALLFFHLRVGARLALRALAPFLATTLFLFYVLGPEFALQLARALFVEGSLLESGAVGTLLLVGLARVVVPRIAAGSTGWARSLPVDGWSLRWLAALSMLVAETPLLTVMVGLAWAATGPNPARMATKLAGILVGAAAANLTCLQSRTAFSRRLVPASACFLSFAGSGVGLAAATGLLLMSAAFPAGPIASRRRGRPGRSLPSASFFFGLSRRAVGARMVLAYLPPALVLAAARLFFSNNELPPDKAFSLSLFCMVLSLALFIGIAADILAVRRPVWPWLRSLPLSSAARVRADASYLIAHALPLAFGLAVLGRPALDVVYLAGPVVWLGVRASGAMRTAGDRPFSVLGQAVLEGTILSLILSLLPWASFVLAAAAPVAFVAARNAESRLKPTRWTERRHSYAGDPLSWSAS